MVVAGDCSAASDDLAQRRRLVNFKIMYAVLVVADSVVHVLDKITTERDVDELSAPANRQQRQVIGERDVRHSKIKCILLLIDPVMSWVRLLA